MVYRVDEYPSTLNNRYHLLGVIGSGGTGIVWRAHDEILNRQVACKVLPGDAVANPLLQKRFEREARVIASLSHPNIVTLFDAGTEGQFSYLVMEYVRGASLRQILSSVGTLPVDATAALAVDVLSGLSLAHHRRLVHRDIKPANLLLEAGGRVKIADFGIVKTLTNEATEITADGTFMGTSAYASPEQSSGASIGPTSDLYSLGCVLYQCLVGTIPVITGDKDHRALREQLNGASALTDVPPETADAISHAIIKALATDPSERFANAKEMAARFAHYANEDSLKDLASPALVPDAGENTEEIPLKDTANNDSGLGTTLSPTGSVQDPSSKTLRTSRIAISVVVGLVLLIGVAIAVWVLTQNGPEKTPARVTSIPAGGFLQPGQSISSPNGLFVLSMQKDGNLVLYARPTKTVRWQSGTSGNFSAYVVMQPDGNLVVYPQGKSAPAPGQRTSALWQSGTFGGPGSSAHLLDTGVLVVQKAGSGDIRWTS